MSVRSVLVIASFSTSLQGFRGPLIAGMVSRGCRVHAAAPELLADESTRNWLESMGCVCHNIPLQRTGLNPAKDLQALVSLVKLIRHVQPDAVFAYTVKPVVWGMIAARLAAVPKRFALITGLGYAFLGQGEGGLRRLLQILVQRLYALALGSVHKVFFQNPDDEALFRQLGILQAGTASMVVNGSGIDVAEFSAAPLPPGAPVFLLIARLLGDKGVREYVAAARQIRAQYPAVVFQLVGWIDDNPDAIGRDELDAWVQEGVVEYLGKLSDVRPAIATSTVYVLPSYREGTPRTILEAMAMGRAVITTDAPGCRETVKHGENGFLVPIKDVSALAHAMQRFLEEPALAIEMGQRSREIAQDKYDVHKVNAVMMREMGL